MIDDDARAELRSFLEHTDAEVAAHPAWPDLKLRQGLLRKELGDRAGAAEAIEAALAQNPSYRDARASLALLLAEQGDAQVAEPALARLRADHGDDWRARLVEAVALLALDRAADALAAAEQALALAPRRQPAAALYLQAELLGRLGRAEAARSALASIREASPELARALERQPAPPPAEDLPAPGQAAGGEAPARAWVDLARGWLRRQLAFFLAEQGREERAPFWLDQALRADLDLAEHEGARGELAFAAGEMEQAVASFEAALRLDPTLVWPRVSCAFAHGVLDRPADAVQQLRAAIEQRPRYPDLRYHLAILLADRGDGDGAAAELEQALAIHPGYADALYALGLLRAAAGAGEEARSLLERARAAGIEHDELRLELAFARLACGEPDGVRELLEPLAAQGWPEAAHLGLALLAERAGDPDEARSALARYHAAAAEAASAPPEGPAAGERSSLTETALAGTDRRRSALALALAERLG